MSLSLSLSLGLSLSLSLSLTRTRSRALNLTRTLTKALFGTVAANLQRVQTALEQQALPLLATMVRTVERAEGRRLTIELERQVLYLPWLYLLYFIPLYGW